MEERMKSGREYEENMKMKRRGVKRRGEERRGYEMER